MDTSRLFKFCFCLLLLMPLWVAAQQKQYSEEVTVVAPYQPTISDANKINQNPEIRDTVYPKPKFTYTIQSTPFPTVYTPEPIEAAKMAGEPVKKLYENLIRLGFGSYSTPYGEYVFNSTRSKELAYGVHLKHLSSSGKIDKYAYPGYSQNELNVFARQFKDKKYNLFAEGNYKREVVHYYGFNPDDFNPAPSDKDIRQRFNLIGLNTRISSSNSDSSQLAYSAKLGGYHLSDKYNTAETKVSLEGGIERTQKLLNISKEQRWGILGKLDFFNDKAKNRKSSGNVVFELRPFLYAQRGLLKLKAGFNATIEADSSTYLHLYPEIELRALVIPQWLSLYFGVTGKTERNSYKKFTDDNPFVIPEIPLNFMNTKYKLYGGFNSNIANIFDIFLEMSLSQVENQYFYVNDITELIANKFTVAYDKSCDVFDLKSEVAWHYSKHFSLMYRFHLHQYSTSDVLPWQISDYDMSLDASYNIQDKLKFDLAVIYFDRMYALTYNPAGHIESKYLRDRFDLNLGMEYRYNRMISAFIHLNNLAGIRYYYWNNYPVQKFNLLGGLSFSF